MAFHLRRKLRRAFKSVTNLFRRNRSDKPSTILTISAPILPPPAETISSCDPSITVPGNANDVNQVRLITSLSLAELTVNRVRTLTGKEIELDIEPEYKVSSTALFAKLNTRLTRSLFTGFANQRKSGGKGRNTTSTTTFDFWRKANVRLLFLSSPFSLTTSHIAFFWVSTIVILISLCRLLELHPTYPAITPLNAKVRTTLTNTQQDR
jgi:hypothetical protein